MPVTAVVGAQWGDEGKGRIIDYLAQQAEMVIRFQGGDNAGHTVVNERGVFRLHLVPSGIFNPETRCLLGAGTVVNPQTVLEEIAELEAAGVSTRNLWISERAHVVMPYHRTLDGLEEAARGGAQIGTTRRGIGPAYADKAARSGIRMGDLRRPEHLRERLAATLVRANRELERFDQPALALEALLDQAREWGTALDHRIIDTVPLVRDALTGGERILLEGQLGVMRDLDWGTYPYVTSSNPIAGGAYPGAGLPPRSITEVVGVVKAYCTAVGAGPFPTELLDETGSTLREVGQEFGATTGRPRRCGWFDAVALAITKLDVLDALPELRICTAYRIGDETTTAMPDAAEMALVEPVYETWPGWRASTRDARDWYDLPPRARAYLNRISSLCDVPIQYVSVGPERDSLIVR
jgi:adenylosuccinate synthase